MNPNTHLLAVAGLFALAGFVLYLAFGIAHAITTDPDAQGGAALIAIALPAFIVACVFKARARS